MHLQHLQIIGIQINVLTHLYIELQFKHLLIYILQMK